MYDKQIQAFTYTGSEHWYIYIYIYTHVIDNQRRKTHFSNRGGLSIKYNQLCYYYCYYYYHYYYNYHYYHSSSSSSYSYYYLYIINYYLTCIIWYSTCDTLNGVWKTHFSNRAGLSLSDHFTILSIYCLFNYSV